LLLVYQRFIGIYQIPALPVKLSFAFMPVPPIKRLSLTPRLVVSQIYRLYGRQLKEQALPASPAAAGREKPNIS
jgi:hypothetical protein